MSGMMPGRLVEAMDKLAIQARQREGGDKAGPPASPSAAADAQAAPASPIPPTPTATSAASTAAHAPASPTSPTPTTAAAGAARAAALVTVPCKTDPGRQMRAVVWRGKKHVAVEEHAPVPLVTDPNDAVVRVEVAAICGEKEEREGGRTIPRDDTPPLTPFFFSPKHPPTNKTAGSDLHLCGGHMPGMKSGDVLGHECMGIVQSVGPEVKSVKVGDRVSVAFDLACGRCYFCRNDLFSGCDITNVSATQQALYGARTSAALGYSHLTAGHAGCHADFVRVPFADVNLLPLREVEEEAANEMRQAAGGGGAAGGDSTITTTSTPTSSGGKITGGGAGDGTPTSKTTSAASTTTATGKITDAQAALLGDVLPTAWTACELGGVEKGSFVCIWGAGPIGLVAAQCAAHRGARRIILVDPLQDRLDLARKPGVVLRGAAAGGCRLDTVKISASGLGGGLETALKDVAKLCKGEPAGAPDVAIEAVGQHYSLSALHRVEMATGAETDSAEAFNCCLRCVRKGGRVAVVGVFAGLANHVHLGALMEKGLHVAGSQAPVQKYWRMLAAKVARGELDPSAVVTHVLPLEEAPRGFKLFDEKKEGCVKVLLSVGGRLGGGGGGGCGASSAKQEVAAVAVV
jgi:threonine dehydrogenase-like Zn-dependent dehydrogenase